MRASLEIIRNTLREFLMIIATVAKASCKHGLWLIARVNKSDPYAVEITVYGHFQIVCKTRKSAEPAINRPMIIHYIRPANVQRINGMLYVSGQE